MVITPSRTRSYHDLFIPINKRDRLESDTRLVRQLFPLKEAHNSQLEIDINTSLVIRKLN